jgi:two-component system cell cycle response regulator DivK
MREKIRHRIDLSIMFAGLTVFISDGTKSMQHQKTILVVDDNGSNRLVPGLILRPLGFTVLETSSGQVAIDLLPQVEVSGVLLDIQMPGVSGLEVLRRIRSDPRHHKTKVIAYTAYANSGDVGGLIAQGFDAVLLKPIKSIDLINTLSY